MKHFKCLMAFLLIVCFMFTLTGCQKTIGNDVDSATQIEESADSNLAAPQADDQEKMEHQADSPVEGIVDAESPVPESAASETVEQETEPVTDAEEDNTDEIIIPSDMGIGDE